jgi:hypothetical protein
MFIINNIETLIELSNPSRYYFKMHKQTSGLKFEMLALNWVESGVSKLGASSPIC